MYGASWPGVVVLWYLNILWPGTAYGKRQEAEAVYVATAKGPVLDRQDIAHLLCMGKTTCSFSADR